MTNVDKSRPADMGRSFGKVSFVRAGPNKDIPCINISFSGKYRGRFPRRKFILPDLDRNGNYVKNENNQIIAFLTYVEALGGKMSDHEKRMKLIHNALRKYKNCTDRDPRTGKLKPKTRRRLFERPIDTLLAETRAAMKAIAADSD